jgi:exopolyphosphatase/guanosine-5'-triphosphate,3'-diphosphate pyrophosphatase
MQDNIAVIDIGSNTIKLLVANRVEPSGQVGIVFRKTVETRIGKGISAHQPVLSPDSILRATDTVASLVHATEPFEPSTIRIVATSAARDAANGSDLAAAILKKTGLSLEILSGAREGELIGGAIQLDPHITARDFYVFDLGGGSLECLRFSKRRLEQVVSLPLGCVRLAEKLLADPAAVFTPEDEERIGREIHEVIEASGFTFSLPADSISIGTGGTLTTALDIIAGQRSLNLDQMPPYLGRAELRRLLGEVAGLDLADRLQVPRLSAGRADVLPTALATFLQLATLTNKEGLHHSSFNLRYGLAAEMLDLTPIEAS